MGGTARYARRNVTLDFFRCKIIIKLRVKEQLVWGRRGMTVRRRHCLAIADCAYIGMVTFFTSFFFSGRISRIVDLNRYR